MRLPVVLTLALLASLSPAQVLRRTWQSERVDPATVQFSAKYVVFTRNGVGPQVHAADDFRKLAEWPGIPATLSGDFLLQLRDNQFQAYGERGKRLSREWKWPAPADVRWMTLAGPTLYFTDASGIHAMSTTSGEILSTCEDFALTDGVVGGDRIYFADTKELVSLERDHLERGWRLESKIQYLDADSNGVYGTTSDYQAVAIDPDGQGPGLLGLGKPLTWYFDRKAPAAIGNTVFLTGSLARRSPNRLEVLGKYLSAFARDTGQLRWKVSLNALAVVKVDDRIAVLVKTRDGKAHLELRSASDGRLAGSSPNMTLADNFALKSSGNRIFLTETHEDGKIQVSAFETAPK